MSKHLRPVPPRTPRCSRGCRQRLGSCAPTGSTRRGRRRGRRRPALGARLSCPARRRPPARGLSPRHMSRGPSSSEIKGGAKPASQSSQAEDPSACARSRPAEKFGKSRKTPTTALVICAASGSSIREASGLVIEASFSRYLHKGPTEGGRAGRSRRRLPHLLALLALEPLDRCAAAMADRRSSQNGHPVSPVQSVGALTRAAPPPRRLPENHPAPVRRNQPAPEASRRCGSSPPSAPAQQQGRSKTEIW